MNTSDIWLCPGQLKSQVAVRCNQGRRWMAERWSGRMAAEQSAAPSWGLIPPSALRPSPSQHHANADKCVNTQQPHQLWNANKPTYKPHTDSRSIAISQLVSSLSRPPCDYSSSGSKFNRLIPLIPAPHYHCRTNTDAHTHTHIRSNLLRGASVAWRCASLCFSLDATVQSSRF